MSFNIRQIGNDLLLEAPDSFILDQTLDCGQTFRFNKTSDESWHGVAFGKVIELSQNASGILFHNTDSSVFENLYRSYFDLDTDYSEISAVLCENKILAECYSCASGIRIMNQEPFETLCSFIISQNNNIPRIKGIISRLCENFGERISESDFSFPSAEKLALASPEDLAPLRAGFRTRYILSAAHMVAEGKIDLGKLKNTPFEEAKHELMKICGVGDKVAQCTLLFGLGRKEAFPADVWIKRIMTQLLPGGLPECAGKYAGIAQQYLYYYARWKMGAAG